MRTIRRVLLGAVVALASPGAARAAGGHDAVGCIGCHPTKGGEKGLVAPNRVAIDPATRQPYGGITAVCLACHEASERGGQGYAPIERHASHPFGAARVNPKVARVPAELLGKDGTFGCTSCHDPHPSNARWRYLRVDVGAKGEKLDRFCAECHALKADPSIAPR